MNGIIGSLIQKLSNFRIPPLHTDSHPCIRIGGHVECIGDPMDCIGNPVVRSAGCHNGPDALSDAAAVLASSLASFAN